MTVTGKFAATFLELALATEGEAGIEPQASGAPFLAAHCFPSLESDAGDSSV